MKPPSHSTGSDEPSLPGKTQAGETGATGLPGLRSWRKVYFAVLGSFVLWVVILAALTRIFS